MRSVTHGRDQYRECTRSPQSNTGSPMADVVEIHETQDDFEVDEEGDRKLHYIPFT